MNLSSYENVYGNIFSSTYSFQMKYDMRKKKNKPPPFDEKLSFSLRGTSLQRKSNVQGEVESFNLYGDLRKAVTEMHNSLPSAERTLTSTKWVFNVLDYSYESRTDGS